MKVQRVVAPDAPSAVDELLTRATAPLVLCDAVTRGWPAARWSLDEWRSLVGADRVVPVAFYPRQCAPHEIAWETARIKRKSNTCDNERTMTSDSVLTLRASQQVHSRSCVWRVCRLARRARAGARLVAVSPAQGAVLGLRLVRVLVHVDRSTD